MKKLLLILSIPFLLQSCFVAKEYERPEVEEISEDLFRSDNISTDTTNLARVSWKEIYTDPLLQNYIEQGLENNLDIRIAIQQMLAAEAYMLQGRQAYLPTLNAGPGVTHQILSRNSQFGRLFDGSITQYEVTANLSWEADIWGKIRSNRRAFEATYLQTAAAHQAVKTSLIANIASTYYQLLALDEQKRITEETLKNRESSLETTRALKEAGSLTEVGVKQTEAQVYTAQAILLDIENEIRLLENSFSILLGEAPQQIRRNELEDQQLNTTLTTGIPTALLANRPDVIAAEYQLINAFELTNVARADFYPSLSLTATTGFQSLELSELFSVNSLFANLAGSLLQPVLNGRRIRTEFEVAEARQQEALLNFRKALLTAGREVSDALANYETGSQKIEIKTNEFEAYNTASEYSEELLNNGLINYLEVLTARENSLNSQLDVVNARLMQMQAVVELYRALGGGWQ